MFNAPAAVLMRVCPASVCMSADLIISAKPLSPSACAIAPIRAPKSVTSHSACILFCGDCGIAILIEATFFLVKLGVVNLAILSPNHLERTPAPVTAAAFFTRFALLPNA